MKEAGQPSHRGPAQLPRRPSGGLGPGQWPGTAAVPDVASPLELVTTSPDPQAAAGPALPPCPCWSMRPLPSGWPGQHHTWPRRGSGALQPPALVTTAHRDLDPLPSHQAVPLPGDLTLTGRSEQEVGGRGIRAQQALKAQVSGKEQSPVTTPAPASSQPAPVASRQLPKATGQRRRPGLFACASAQHRTLSRRRTRRGDLPRGRALAAWKEKRPGP